MAVGSSSEQATVMSKHPFLGRTPQLPQPAHKTAGARQPLEIGLQDYRTNERLVCDFVHAASHACPSQSQGQYGHVVAQRAPEDPRTSESTRLQVEHPGAG